MKKMIQMYQRWNMHLVWYLLKSVSQENGSGPVTELTIFWTLADREKLKAEETK